jgi:DNA-binding beta-propeller fold protein YncE
MTRTSDTTHVAHLLPAYAAGTLDAADRRSVLAHLAGCPACRTELAAWQVIQRGARAVYSALPEDDDGLQQILRRVEAFPNSGPPVMMSAPDTTLSRRLSAAPSPRPDVRWSPLRRSLAYLTTAALLLLTLLSSFLAFGPGRLGWPAHQETVLPAITGSPATPQPIVPIAEFLWQTDGRPSFPLVRPTGAAVDAQGNVWVTDGAKDRILIIAAAGEGVFPGSSAALEAWGTPDSGEGEFDFQCSGFGYGDVAIDVAGNIYVADSGNQRIQKFAPDRTFLMSWGSEGIADGQFLCPTAVAVDRQGRVYASDLAGKIEVFAPDGERLATWDEEASSPGRLAIDGDGHVWVADGTNAILELAPDGSLLATWDTRGSGAGELSSPLGLAIDADGRVFVSDFASRVQVFAPDGAFLGAWGSHGSAPGQFTIPNALALDGRGHIYVTEEDGRVHKFRLLPPLAP